MTPPTRTMVAVPRSGWTRISPRAPAPAAPATGRAIAGRRRRQQVVEAGQHQHHRRLHELGRLEADEAEIEPALRALADEAHHLDQDQQDQDRDIGREGHLLDEVVGDVADRDRQAEEGEDADALLGRPWATGRPPAAE